MDHRKLIIFAAVLGVLTLGWAMRDRNPAESSRDLTARAPAAAQRRTPGETAEAPGAQRPSSAPAAANAQQPQPSGSPVNIAARAKFNEDAREFFATHDALMSPAERQREAQRIERELSRLEQAGGLSAGEVFLVRAGLIRATVPDEAEQVAQIKALKERYERESQRRVAETVLQRPDPAFELYKVREHEIVAEVMSMESIPNGLTREEYLRRRLQAAREQLMP